MSLSSYFEEHEEQAFVAKALATAVAIILVKNFLACLLTPLLILFPVLFLVGIRMHAAASGVDPSELLREHITFFPVMRSEKDRKTEVTPWVTYGIIFLNMLVFYGFETYASDKTIDSLVFLPHDPDFINVPLSAFTSIFLHASNGHLWGNMTFLWVVGTAVERRVGRLRFLWLYLLTGLIGGLVYILVEFLFHGRAGHILGASGAIAGIMGIFAIRCYFKSMIFPVPILGVFSLILPISLKIRLNSLVIMALFFLSDLSGGIEQIAGESTSMIGHWAHLGGMISGMFIAGFLKLGEAAVEERHLEIGIKASEATVGYGGGERSLKIALERSPENIEALLGLARIKTKFSSTEEGKELYEKVIGLMLKGGSAEVVHVFREYYGKYLMVPPDAAAVSRLAELLRKEGDTERTIDCLEYVVKAEGVPPQTVERSLFQLATLLEFTSRFEAARSHFARFAAEYPDSVLVDTARQKAGNAVYAPARPKEEKETAAAKLCPSCGKPMATRPATAGAHKGRLFQVCADYPACRTALPVQEAAEAAEHRQAPPPLPERYRIVLDGTLPFTSDPKETKENLARLFRCDRDRVERLLRGEPTVLKKGLDRETALKMKEALDGTGALCTMEEEKAQPVAAAPPPPRANPQAPPQPQAAHRSPVAAPQRAFSCPKCGFEQEKGEACARCGVYFAKLAGAAEREYHSFREHLPGGAARRGMSEKQERRWAMWCHLLSLSGLLIPFGNLLGPLAIWLWKRNESDFVDYHGKTALNYQLTLVLFIIGSTVVAFFTGFAAIVVGPLFGILGIYTLAMVITSAIKSLRGDAVEISLSAEFIK